MKTTITAKMKQGKYRRPHFDILNEVAEILNNFIINNKLEKKKIKYKGLKIKNSIITVEYEFIDEFKNIFRRKNVSSSKEERKVNNGNKKTRKRNPAT